MAISTSPSKAHEVGNDFVDQYYSFLRHKPEEVHKFYKESSAISRSDYNNNMAPITTVNAIGETIRNLVHGNFDIVIETVDAQLSCKDGVIVCVIGWLTTEDNIVKKFSQTFFLAPQENCGYYVLNDLFRYVSDDLPPEVTSVAENHTKETSADAPIDSVSEVTSVAENHTKETSADAPIDSVSEVTSVAENHTKETSADAPIDSVSEVTSVAENHTKETSADAPIDSVSEVTSVTENHTKETSADAPIDSVSEVTSVAENHTKETSPDAPIDSVSEPSDENKIMKGNEEAHSHPENEGSVMVAVEPSLCIMPPPDVEVILSESEIKEDAPKMSYASIVKIVKVAPAPAVKPKLVGVNAGKKAVALAPTSPPEISNPNAKLTPGNNKPKQGVEGYSIYIRNLPPNATPSQLATEFRKFGAIKTEGVQVRNHKQHGYCFGFVEFEHSSSMQLALEASPISIAGHRAFIEEKRTTARVGSSNGNINPSSQGRFPNASMGGFRGDNFRGHGGYGRNMLRGRGEFSNRGGRGPSGRSSDVYQHGTHPRTMMGTPV